MPKEALPVGMLQSLPLPNGRQPKGNVGGSIQIRVLCMTTRVAPEPLAPSVPLANPTTTAAPLAGVSRVDLRGLDARILAGPLQLPQDGGIREMTQITTAVFPPPQVLDVLDPDPLDPAQVQLVH